MKRAWNLHDNHGDWIEKQKNSFFLHRPDRPTLPLGVCSRDEAQKKATDVLDEAGISAAKIQGHTLVWSEKGWLLDGVLRFPPAITLKRARKKARVFLANIMTWCPIVDGALYQSEHNDIQYSLHNYRGNGWIIHPGDHQIFTNSPAQAQEIAAEYITEQPW